MSASSSATVATGVLALCLFSVTLPVPGALVSPGASAFPGASPPRVNSLAALHAPTTGLTGAETTVGYPAHVAVAPQTAVAHLPARTGDAPGYRRAALQSGSVALARGSLRAVQLQVVRPTRPSADRGYRPPVAPAVLLAPFAAPPEPWRAGHRGVDLASSTGDAVHAPGDGVVMFAGTVVDRGVLTILHHDGLRTSLEPVAVDAALTVGMTVTAGDEVGTVEGSSHCDPGSCLHWGVRRGETYLDPLSLLPGAGPTVLLPVP